MILAIDVHYKDQTAKAVGLLFDWCDSEPKEVITDYLLNPDEYLPGAFYKRELPCILKIIEKVNIEHLEAIIIDGYVYVDNDKKNGLGGHVWQTLKSGVPVIGVAKNYYHGNTETVISIMRGDSVKPLYISSIGISNEEAVIKIESLHGTFRIPTILKLLDRLTKQ